MRFNRAFSLATAIAIVASAASCGGPSNQEQIKGLVDEYVSAFAAKDGAKVCSLLTPQAQRKVQIAAGMLRGRNCAATITLIARMPTGDAARAIRKFHAGKIVVDKNEAGVLIEPATPGTKPTRLVKVNGKWLFDGSVATAQ